MVLIESHLNIMAINEILTSSTLDELIIECNFLINIYLLIINFKTTESQMHSE